MIAFHGDKQIKEKYLKRVRAHRLADEIVKGQYWNDGKGCAVGCTIHGSDHTKYETELGIPYWLAKVEDTLFEGMSIEASKTWPERFLKAIRPGADLKKAKGPFLIFVMQSTLEHFDHKKFPDVKQAIDSVIDLYSIEDATPEDFEEARQEAAEAAAWAAARAARAAEAAARAARAAEAAARAAEAAARAAEAAARAAAWAAERAWAAAAWEYEKFADKLIEILESL